VSAPLAAANAATPSPSPSPSAPAANSGGAAPASTLTWSIQPSSATKPDSRDSFTYQDFDPGTTHPDNVAIENFSATAQTFEVYASDAFNTATGGFDLLPGATKPTDVGSWVTLGSPRAASIKITIPARSSKIVPFTVKVPQSATPGFHTGGIVAVSSTVGKDVNGDNVLVDRRVGVRIYLQVTGPLKPTLKVENFSVKYQGTWNPVKAGTATVTYTVLNDGNVPLEAHQSLKLSGLFGLFGKTVKMADAPLLLPGGSIKMAATVKDVWPGGQLTATAHLTPFTTIINLPTRPSAVASQSSVLAMPWTWLIILVVVVLLFVGNWLRHRRQRRPKPPRPAAPAPPAPPTPPTSNDPTDQATPTEPAGPSDPATVDA
jgi:hypothetical protein